ncbi:unnamed protein product, partial [Didymodactylos carnosus]
WSVAEKFLRQTLAAHQNSAEAWYLLGLARRKLCMYEEANLAFRTALEIQPNYAAAQRDHRILHHLRDEPMEKRLELYNRMTTICNKIREETSYTYNILCNDGGGIRGLISAIWTAEIERLTNSSAVSLFNMMSGTSTGAIVAAGLCAPNREHPTLPRYKAADIVKLYVANGNKVFEKPRGRWWYNFRRAVTQEAKYISESRHKLFKAYFDHTKLSHMLSELVVPAVKNDSQITHLFNKYDCRNENAVDYEVHDVLMCTTAAPTYFSPHKLGTCQYVDGGIQMNNPVMAAYSEALRYDPSRKDRLFVLSLGTGDYVPNPLHPSADRHLLFYGKHTQEILNIVVDGPQYNVDMHMLSVLGKERYQRWQVWFEEPISLDAVDKASIDMLFDKAREFF